MTKFEDAVVVWRGIKCLSSGMAAVWSAVSAVIFFKMRILTSDRRTYRPDGWKSTLCGAKERYRKGAEANMHGK